MKTLYTLPPLCPAALLLMTASASAQNARFSDIDQDGNGVLSYNELVQSFGTTGANQLWSLGDGNDLSRDDILRINQARDDDDDDGGQGSSLSGRDDDDDDGRRMALGGRDDDDDDGRPRTVGRDDDDDDGGRDDDDDDGGRDDDDDDGGSDDDDDDGGSDNDDDD
ncbi:MAG: hypothetical protein R6V30_02560 [Paracoccaceae bacterium]